MIEEKKLTDKELVKAMEICANWGSMSNCKDCPIGLDVCCENQNGFAKYALDFIHRLQNENAKQKAEIEKLHTLTDLQEANVNTVFENNMELRKEIERLTKELKVSERNLTVESRNYERSNHIVGLLKGENAELQKQVDELKFDKDILQKLIDKREKDTAKEILCELLDIEVKDKDYEMFFLDVCEKLEKFAQKYGVEVG